MEISKYLDFDFLIRFLEGLQKFLGENSEILIHDYRKGYDHTIVYALNAALSGRDVGGSPKGGMITQFGKYRTDEGKSPDLLKRSERSVLQILHDPDPG